MSIPALPPSKEAIRTIWAYAQTPALDQLKKEGRLEEAKAWILETAFVDLKAVFPNEEIPPHDYANALELAAAKWLNLNPLPR